MQNGVWKAEKKQMIERWKKVYKDLDLGELVMLDKHYKFIPKEQLK